MNKRVVFGVLWSGLVIALFFVLRNMGVDLFIPMWVITAIFGGLFFLSDNFILHVPENSKGFLKMDEEVIDRMIEERREAARDNSVFTTYLVILAFPFLICLVLCYLL
ncbi:MAG: hypothetical protein HUJ57_07190 [Erysipelotrichaceae bacterium]|nr:hypothetical protein [Erysipelotrichaceae bacterium]